MTAVAGLVLAAGEGSRFGRPKALLRLGEATFAERAVATLASGGAEPVVLVTGAAEVTVSGARSVRNPSWRTGMGSSLAAGLAALSGIEVASRGSGQPAVPPAPQAAVIALADQPFIGAEAVERLITAYRDGAQVAVACYQGRPRNPVLIARALWPEVLALAAGDTGARPFLRAHPELVTPVECGDTGSPDDIDTPEDLARAQRRVTAGE